MTRLRWTLVVTASLLSGCATLPPHQWIKVPHVEEVSFFWWPELRQCDLRIIYWDFDTPRGITVPRVDPRLCR